MSYQIMNNIIDPESVLATLAQELISNGYTVNRVNEVVGSQKCTTWTDGSGVYFNLDLYSATDSGGFTNITASMSTGYISGILGVNQLGAENNDGVAGSTYVARWRQYGFGLLTTIIVVTDSIVYVRQYIDSRQTPSILFMKANLIEYGSSWIGTRTNYFKSHSFASTYSELMEHADGSGGYSLSPSVLIASNPIIKLQSIVFSDLIFLASESRLYIPVIDGDRDKDNLADVLLNSSFYSTRGLPINLYAYDSGVYKPFGNLDIDIVVGNPAYMNDFDEITIGSNKYINIGMLGSNDRGRGTIDLSNSVQLIRFDK